MRDPPNPAPQRCQTRTAQLFNESYAGSAPAPCGASHVPAQPAFLDPGPDRGLSWAGAPRGGCGTGVEHALLAASLGHGDARRRLRPARRSSWPPRRRPLGGSRRRSESSTHCVCPSWTPWSNTVVDCGLFHVFDDEQRAVSSMA